MIKQIVVLLLSSMLLHLQAAPDSQQQAQMVSKYYPKNMLNDSNKFSSPDQIRDSFEINIESMPTKKILNRKDRYSAIVNDIFDAEILAKPLVKQLKTMDTLYSHPNFISVIKFPPSVIINQASTTIPMSHFSFSENLLQFSINRNAPMGNIVITAFDKEIGKNKVFNFIVKKYSNTSSAKYDNEYGLYATNDGEFLSLSVFYTQIQKVDEIKILQKYVELNGLQALKKQFTKHGDFETLLLDGVPVFITRDDKNGNISYYDINFRISIGGN